MSASNLESRDHVLIAPRFSESECFIIILYCCLAGNVQTYAHTEVFFKHSILYLLLLISFSLNKMM